MIFDVANYFNHYFCSIAETIEKSSLFNEYFSYDLSNYVSESISSDTPNLNEIMNSIYDLNYNKAIGIDVKSGESGGLHCPPPPGPFKTCGTRKNFEQF